MFANAWKLCPKRADKASADRPHTTDSSIPKIKVRTGSYSVSGRKPYSAGLHIPVGVDEEPYIYVV